MFALRCHQPFKDLAMSSCLVSNWIYCFCCESWLCYVLFPWCWSL